MPFPAAPCYLIEPTDTLQRYLRRYTKIAAEWTCASGWHEARARVEDAPVVWAEREAGRRTYSGEGEADDFTGDPRWPTHCDRGCGYEFAEADERQLFNELVYRVAAAAPGSALDVGMETTLRDAPPGAMWYADWLPERWHGLEDGRALMVKLPNGSDWIIDSVASNCDRRDDEKHRCWLRHGEPPFVTVDKEGGPTCTAGAGSIGAGEGDRYYHGFLHLGILTAG